LFDEEIRAPAGDFQQNIRKKDHGQTTENAGNYVKAIENEDFMPAPAIHGMALIKMLTF
jgi:hypothetical protein